ncbi:MAG: CFA/I fimbrial subunit E [Stenotrophomonas maltophilia]|uniref:CFA/I fimbrial subunit E n=1 Tax=Stenotrophomonas maltophilia TaxID=40324 RepID=A0A7V8JLC9_STEMA|nr:MAG: CFA/I fimbrial subunit E [Stenotrophomonas maltophilia]
MKLGWVLVLAGLVVGVPEAWGQQPPETHPASSNRDIVMSWNRSAMPREVELIPRRTVLAYEATGTLGYGRAFFTCNSSTNSSEGKCPTEDTGEEATSKLSIVQVLFTETRSSMSVDVAVQGSLLRAHATQRCYSDYWESDPYPLSSSVAADCSFQPATGTGAQLHIPEAKIQRLVAGHWKGKLLLTLRKGNGQELAVQEFNFDFTITDHNAVSIYFPQYESATPLVNLDARFDPIQQTIGGRVVVDMCLYDGLGSQASFLGVTARHTSARAPGPTGFALWHETPGNADSQRLDYKVTLKHSGADVPLANGAETELQGIDSARLRLVLLPGMSQPVFCVPTPMTLDMPLVPVSEKQSGVYWGDLKIELRVPTASP